MKTIKGLVLVSVFALLSLAACDLFREGPKPVQTDSPGTVDLPIAMECDRMGKVVDLTGLDGCGLVIQSDGENFIPISLPPGIELTAGDDVSFSFEEKELANTCMAGKIGDVVCLEVISEVGNCDQQGLTTQSDKLFQTSENGDFRLHESTLIDSKLMLNVAYSGCSPNNRGFQLIVAESISKQNQSQIPEFEAKLVFEPQMCEALFTQNVCFDVSALPKQAILVFRDHERTHKVSITK